MNKARPNYSLRDDCTKSLIKLYKTTLGYELYESLFVTEKRWSNDFYYAYSQSKSGKRIEDADAIWVARYLMESLRNYLFDIEELSKSEVERRLENLFAKSDFSECFDLVTCKACGNQVRHKNMYFYLNSQRCTHNFDENECCHCSYYQSHQVLYILNTKQRAGQGADIDEFLTRKNVWHSKGPFCYLCGVITYYEKPYRMRWTKAKPQMAEIDHIIPLSRGGSHVIQNVAIACSSCNREKSDRSPFTNKANTSEKFFTD
jgi:hypothetical protein